MSSVNKQILIGNLGKDPEMRYLPNGDAVCNFNVATTQKWKEGGTGEAREETQWHRCVAFRRLAEVCGEYLRSGSKVYVEGMTKHRKYEKDGIQRSTTEITIDEMKILSSPRDDQGNEPQRQQAPRQAAPAPRGGQAAPAGQGGQYRNAPPANRAAPAARAAAPRPASGFDDMDDDIPFATNSPYFDQTTSKARRMARHGL